MPYQDPPFVMPSMRLDGAVALVTGASRGIGSGVALALAHAGADLAITARTSADLDRVAAEAVGMGRKVLPVVADLEQPGEPSRIVDATLRHFGRVDVLVTGAGINIRQPADQFTAEQFAQIMRLNVEAPFRLANAVRPVMRDQGRGRIVCVTSVATVLAVPNVSVYAMSKAALGAMVRALALEWAGEGITVNAIAPGRYWTAMTDAVFSDPERHASAVGVIPLGRPGVPADVAGAAVLLASDAGAYTTGQTLFIDGGWTTAAAVKA
jgi:NAD(P)-dependent dehydrogenase (short-subunit alcohol dehydrogenase family)